MQKRDYFLFRFMTDVEITIVDAQMEDFQEKSCLQ